jgi:hypothetical protein
MYRGFKIKAFVPYGREKTCDLLFKYFIKHSDVIDEVMLLENTKVESDLQFMQRTADSIPKLFKIYKIPSQHRFIESPVQHNTGKFYEYMTDLDTIYIRFDDDIVFIDDNYFKNILDFRIDNLDYFVVFGNIINNAMCGYLQQEADCYPRHLFNIDSGYCMNMRTWGNPSWGIFIHKLLLDRIKDNEVDSLFFPNKELTSERFSISNFCFFGKDFAKFNGVITNIDEEIFLTEIYPDQTKIKNIICGNALVSHFTFSPYQKAFILQTDILDRYIKIAEKKLSDDYYKLLKLQQDEVGKP